MLTSMTIFYVVREYSHAAETTNKNCDLMLSKLLLYVAIGTKHGLLTEIQAIPESLRRITD